MSPKSVCSASDAKTTKQKQEKRYIVKQDELTRVFNKNDVILQNLHQARVDDLAAVKQR